MPPVFHPMTTVSYSPAGVVIVCKPIGDTCSPPIFAILPQDGLVNSFGPFPAKSVSAVANAESHAKVDLYTERYEDILSLPPVGSGASLPTSIYPLITLFPSSTNTCIRNFSSLFSTTSFSTHIVNQKSEQSLYSA